MRTLNSIRVSELFGKHEVHEDWLNNEALTFHGYCYTCLLVGN